MKITIIAGARPNFVKIAPLIRAIDSANKSGKKIYSRLVYTGSKDDFEIEPSLFTDLEMPIPDSYLNVTTNDFFERTSQIILTFAKELENNPTNAVIVIDDFTPTMACSLVAKKKGIKVIHIVAGIRSFDINTPKEVNRMISDGLSDILFTAGSDASKNLANVGTNDQSIFFVGNILIDSLRYSLPKAIKPIFFQIANIREGNYILLTLNKKEFINDDKKLRKSIETILANSDKKIVAPLRSYVSQKIKSLKINSDRLIIVPPQSYLNFIYIIKNAWCIITDSGNISEEATFVSTPCITLSNYTEQIETVKQGSNVLVNEDFKLLKEYLEKLNNGNWKDCNIPERWDGRTSDRIVQIILEDYSTSKRDQKV